MIRRILSQSWGLVLIFAVWQIWVMAGHYNSIVIVSPLAVLRNIAWHPLNYAAPALWTFSFAIAGLGAGLVAGLLLAIAAWRAEILAGAISPIALMASSTPIVCLIPLVARVFGYGSRTEFVTIAIMTFFPAFVYASQGLRQLPPMSSEFFAVLAATRVKQLSLLALPAALPNLAVAFRIGAAYSILVAMVSEYLMQTGGLGSMFALANQAFQTEQAWGASLTGMALSLAFYAASGTLEERIRLAYS